MSLCFSDLATSFCINSLVFSPEAIAKDDGLGQDPEICIGALVDVATITKSGGVAAAAKFVQAVAQDEYFGPGASLLSLFGKLVQGTKAVDLPCADFGSIFEKCDGVRSIPTAALLEVLDVFAVVHNAAALMAFVSDSFLKRRGACVTNLKLSPAVKKCFSSLDDLLSGSLQPVISGFLSRTADPCLAIGCIVSSADISKWMERAQAEIRKIKLSLVGELVDAVHRFAQGLSDTPKFASCISDDIYLKRVVKTKLLNHPGRSSWSTKTYQLRDAIVEVNDVYRTYIGNRSADEVYEVVVSAKVTLRDVKMLVAIVAYAACVQELTGDKQVATACQLKGLPLLSSISKPLREAVLEIASKGDGEMLAKNQKTSHYRK